MEAANAGKTSGTKRRSTSGASRSGSKAKPAPKTKKPRDRCFVISPFGGWHDDYHREIFCEAIKAAGLDPVRADDLFRSSNIVHDIWHMVLDSRVMLADLTGKNPNVFYELGLAHAAGKPVLLVTQSMEDVPFDLRALRVITYDIEHPRWGQLLKENIETGLRETIEAPERSVLPTFLTDQPSNEVTVPEDERRLLGLQQQIDSLRAEVRDRGTRSGSRIRANEAKALVKELVTSGLGDGAIERRLVNLGAPSSWVREEIDRVRAEILA